MSTDKKMFEDLNDSATQALNDVITLALIKKTSIEKNKESSITRVPMTLYIPEEIVEAFVGLFGNLDDNTEEFSLLMSVLTGEGFCNRVDKLIESLKMKANIS